MKDILLELIRRPWTIHVSQLQKVEQLLQRYPYFQAARLLVARAKQNMRHSDARKTLILASLYTTNKGILRNFLTQKNRPKPKKLLEKSDVAATIAPVEVLAPPAPEDQAADLERPTYITDTMASDERDRLIEDTMREMAILQQTKMQYLQQEEDETSDMHRKLAKDMQKIASMHQSDVKANHGRNPYAVDGEKKANPPTSPTPPVSNVHSGSPVQVIFGYQPPVGGITPPPPPPATSAPHSAVAPSYSYMGPPVSPSPAPPFAAMPPYSYAAPPFAAMPPYSYAAPPFAVMPSYPYTAASVPPVAAPNPAAASAPVPPVAAPNPVASADIPVRNEQNEIIERFIHNIPKVNPGTTDAISAVSLNNDQINNEICSEELAELYQNQGHDERAIDIYYRLCDKYPEKSAYFVQKIKEIKRK